MRIGKAQSLLSLVFLMMLAVILFSSWYRHQESYRDDKGRWAVRYAQHDSLWKKADYSLFLALNGTMQDNPIMQKVWGVTNHRLFDLAAAFWMILLFTIYYISLRDRQERIALLQFGLYMTVVLLLAVLIAELTIHFDRPSPTKTQGLMEQAIVLRDLTDTITWEVKVRSNNSFPGDHTTVLLFIGAFIIWRLRSWYGVAAALGIVVFSLPRLAGGAHWFSDIMAGSLPFFLVLFPLSILAPVRQRVQAPLGKPAVLIHKALSVLERDNQPAE